RTGHAAAPRSGISDHPIIPARKRGRHHPPVRAGGFDLAGTHKPGRLRDLCLPPRAGTSSPYPARTERAMDDLFVKIQEVCRHLFSMQELTETLKQPGFVLAAFVVLNLVIFTETGLLLGFFLPGDSLLVVAGIVAHECEWNLLVLLTTLCAAAIVGDTVGYWIG